MRIILRQAVAQFGCYSEDGWMFSVSPFRGDDLHVRLAQELKESNGFVPNLHRSTAYLFRCVPITAYCACTLATHIC